MNTSSSSIGASKGVSIVKPNTFLNADLYEYKVGPAIFGRIPTAGTVDKLNLTEDIQTTGPLQSAYTADLLDQEAGSWWNSSVSPYQQHVDVALNHPARWVETNEKDALNCLTYDDGLSDYCLAINEPETNDLWNSSYYWMRGLLVTVGGTDGPQLTQATVGDTVWLQARVYNHSFEDMDANTSIKVRFYRQEMSGTDPVGDSVLIDEKQLIRCPILIPPTLWAFRTGQQWPQLGYRPKLWAILIISSGYWSGSKMGRGISSPNFQGPG